MGYKVKSVTTEVEDEIRRRLEEAGIEITIDEDKDDEKDKK